MNTTRFYKTTGFCLLLSITLFTFSCRKEGPGGKSGVKGYVKHHEKVIPNCKVYMKYNATEFPGTDVSIYEASATADANGYYEFKDYRKGDYYLYGVGYDNAIFQPVTGGIAVKLKYNKTTTIDVPVTE